MILMSYCIWLCSFFLWECSINHIKPPKRQVCILAVLNKIDKYSTTEFRTWPSKQVSTCCDLVHIFLWFVELKRCNASKDDNRSYPATYSNERIMNYSSLFVEFIDIRKQDPQSGMATSHSDIVFKLKGKSTHKAKRYHSYIHKIIPFDVALGNKRMVWSKEVLNASSLILAHFRAPSVFSGNLSSR